MDWMDVARFPDGDVGPYLFSWQRQGCIWGQGPKTTSLGNVQVFVTWEYLFLYHHLRKVNSTRQTMDYDVKIKARSRNRCCRGKQLSVKYFVCVCVCVCGEGACLAVSHFYPSQEWYDLKKKIIEHKMHVLIFCTNFI